MNHNIAISTVGTVAWDGAAAFAGDIRKFNDFAWSIETTADITTDAVFNITAAPASDVDKCLPGTFAPVDAIASCSGAAVGDAAQITIPAGTVAGTVCGGTIACRAGAFVKLASASGDTANVKVVLLRGGPRQG